MAAKQNPALAEFTTQELIAEIGARSTPMLITYRDCESFIHTNWGGGFLEVLGLFTLLRKRFVGMIAEENEKLGGTPSDGDTPIDPTGDDTE